MSLKRRTRDELVWPDWFESRRGLPWPVMFKDLLDDSEMKVEEFEEDGELIVRAEMPGIDPETDVDISVADHMLRLKAERREKTESEDKKGYRSEFRYGSFTRVIELPTGATEDDVKATYTDGILEVRIPVDHAEAQTRKIPVKRG